MSALLWNELATPANAEEALLLHPLLAFLRARRWIRPDSIVRTEFAWNGRRVDLAVCTRGGVTSSFELKLGSYHRVLEQAMYNRLSFKRSWVVTSSMPRPANLEQAVENGIGVLVLDERLTIVSHARLQVVSPRVHNRLRSLLEGQRQ